ncbi:MAG: hypothetical protein JNM51_16450, partial [Bacteroidia bacterium]|nr:hypothetical protein [Bacteroidia bacterium]
QKVFWADVRKVWDEVFAKNPNLKLAAKVDNKRLYENLFELGDTTCNGKNYVKGSANAEIKKIIDSFLKV